jgi:hypothetical protein
MDDFAVYQDLPSERRLNNDVMLVQIERASMGVLVAEVCYDHSKTC